MDNRTVGVLGGGQLGRMLVEAANKLGVRVAVLDPEGSSSPAGQISHLCIEGSFKDTDAIRELSSISDVITTEIEHVNVKALSVLASEGRIVHPSPETFRIIQDKFYQKTFLQSKNVPMPDFIDITDAKSVNEAGLRFGYPFILKKKKLAYDGRGNAVVKTVADAAVCFGKLGEVDIYAEKWIPFTKELAVIVVNTKEGMMSYPMVETIQRDNICHAVIAPAQISTTAMKSATDIACNAVSHLGGYGVYGVEMFLLDDDTVLLNEIAPRPHNSGHYTIEACEVDQFEMHLRAILDLPCPLPRMRVGAAIMINVLGIHSSGSGSSSSDDMETTKALLYKALTIQGASVHWYGKTVCKPGRKMAHITITADNITQLRDRLELLQVGSSSDYDLPSLSHSAITASPGQQQKQVRVGIVMGSDSDLNTMKDAEAILRQFRIPCEITIVSAHRTPTRMYSYAQSAVERGIEVIIAGAGGAAHLPGMIAALTSLPVIGVPVYTSTLSGNDSLLSIVQMPRGVPVATVAIGNATNAGLLAVRILAAQDIALRHAMDEYMIAQEVEVLQRSARLETIGTEKYLEELKK